jgi:hypothetical protein
MFGKMGLDYPLSTLSAVMVDCPFFVGNTPNVHAGLIDILCH